MELIYLYHSGFALLGEGCTVVFDYYEDSLSADKGVLHDEILARSGRFYVLSSHSHADHFNPDILAWKEVRPDIIYIFSKDILRHRHLPKETAHWLKKGEAYSDDTLTVHAFGSTDIGISFLVELEGRKVFHAGDLNNWHWMDESTEAEWRGAEKNFFHELDFLGQYTRETDVAMFPVDPRLGREYMRGPRQFVERIRTGLFVPMHFDEAYSAEAAFRPLAEAAGAQMWVIRERGERKIIL